MLRLVDVKVQQGEVPGMVLVPRGSVLTIQVVS
jgi:hypothetical protein